MIDNQTAQNDKQNTDTSAQVQAIVMVRPCERTIKTKLGTVTPTDTNMFASNIQGFCQFIRDLDSIDEIKAVAEAINDNWNRYMDSA